MYVVVLLVIMREGERELPADPGDSCQMQPRDPINLFIFQ